jgi:cytochrome P450
MQPAIERVVEEALDVLEQTGPGADLVQGLNGEISDEEISGLVSTLVVGGHETTAAMLSLSALALVEGPDQLAVLLDESRSTGEAVEELLRYMSNTGTFPRAAKEDLTINGHSVKAGEMVLVSLLNANRDPALAEGNPDELDLTRGPVAHVAFGHGAHQCPERHLARFELEIALSALFRRLPTLKLAVPREDLEFNRSGIIYGLKELPVKWRRRRSCVLPRRSDSRSQRGRHA